MIIPELDRALREPLYVQMFNQISHKIISGAIEDGTRLPSQRELAARLDVSVNTVVNTYNMLVRYGYVDAISKSGYYVNQPKEQVTAPEKDWHSTVPSVYNFSKNGVDLRFNPNFKKVWRQVAKQITDGDFIYPDYTGEYELRKQLCNALKREIELDCAPEQIIIGSNLIYLLDILIKIIGINKTYAFENPVYSKISDFMRLGAAKVKYVNVTTSGICAEDLKELDADVLFLMPYHHYPLSYTMSAEQKRAVLDWAVDGRYVIEYGFDFEFAGDKAGELLYSMSENRNVIFINDFTRTVSPSIYTAYLVLPEPLVKSWQDLYLCYHSGASETEQKFLAEILRDGSWHRNVIRLKKSYDRKRDCFISAFRSHPAGKTIRILNAGCGPFLLIEPQTECSDVTLIDECHKAGIKLSYLKSGAVIPNSRISARCYLLGFGELNEDEIKKGIGILLDTWEPLL